ncbi:MAG: hypothetical protein ACI9N1_000732 [Flavobacteriales bacterium]|jgi:hypothetical protein
MDMNIETIKTDFIEQVKLIRSEETMNKLQNVLLSERMQRAAVEGMEDIENDDFISLKDFQSKNKTWLKSNSTK